MGYNLDEKLDLKIKFDKFAGEFDIEVKEIKRFISFLSVSEKDAVIFKEALSILSTKNKEIKKSRSLTEANIHIKLRKLNEKYRKGDDHV